MTLGTARAHPPVWRPRLQAGLISGHCCHCWPWRSQDSGPLRRPATGDRATGSTNPEPHRPSSSRTPLAGASQEEGGPDAKETRSATVQHGVQRPRCSRTFRSLRTKRRAPGTFWEDPGGGRNLQTLTLLILWVVIPHLTPGGVLCHRRAGLSPAPGGCTGRCPQGSVRRNWNSAHSGAERSRGRGRGGGPGGGTGWTPWPWLTGCLPGSCSLPVLASLWRARHCFPRDPPTPCLGAKRTKAALGLEVSWGVGVGEPLPSALQPTLSVLLICVYPWGVSGSAHVCRSMYVNRHRCLHTYMCMCGGRRVHVPGHVSVGGAS